MVFLKRSKTQLLHIADNKVSKVCKLPSGTHNPKYWKNGIIFNDTASDCLRYVPREGEEIVSE